MSPRPGAWRTSSFECANDMIEVLSRDRRFVRNQTGTRKVIMIVRVRGGNSLRAVVLIPKAKPPHSSALGLRRARLSTLTG